MHVKEGTRMFPRRSVYRFKMLNTLNTRKIHLQFLAVYFTDLKGAP
jgi:hypothetical protein